MQVCGKIQEAVSPIKLVLFALLSEPQIIKDSLTSDKFTAVDISLRSTWGWLTLLVVG